MATSGYVDTNSYNDAYLRLTWERTSYDVVNGINYVHWVLKGVKSVDGYYDWARKFKVTSYNFVTGNSTELYYSDTDIKLYNGTVVAEGDDWFTANSDGTCRIQFNIEGAIYSYSVNCTGYDAWNLDTIPRKSILYASNATINSTQVKFTIDRKSSNFTDSIYYINPSTSEEVLIVNKTSQTTYNWSPPTSLYQYFPNNQNIYMEFKSYTYNGSTLIGTDLAHAYISANATDCKPTLSVTATPTNYSSLTGNANTLIKYVSNVSISVTATPKNSATIKKISTNGTTLSNNSTTGSTTFSNVETNTFTTTTTDSRSYTKTDTKQFTIINYIPLTISANVYRTNQTSSVIKAVITGNYFDGSFGSQTNTLTLTWQCKNNESDNWTTGGTLTATKSNGTYTTGEITLTMPSGINSDYEHNIYFSFKAVDKINTTGAITTPSIKKGEPILDYGLNSSGHNYLNVNGQIYSNNTKIIEKGTNYIKLYDGTLMTRQIKTVSTTIDGTWGNLYISSDISLDNYPVAFIEKPVVNIYVDSSNSAFVMNAGLGTATKPSPINLCRGQSLSTSNTYNIYVNAIGRWK